MATTCWALGGATDTSHPVWSLRLLYLVDINPGFPIPFLRRGNRGTERSAEVHTSKQLTGYTPKPALIPEPAFYSSLQALILPRNQKQKGGVRWCLHRDLGLLTVWLSCPHMVMQRWHYWVGHVWRRSQAAGLNLSILFSKVGLRLNTSQHLEG